MALKRSKRTGAHALSGDGSIQGSTDSENDAQQEGARSADSPPAEPSAEPTERLSWMRVAALVGILGVIAGGAVYGARQLRATDPVLDTSWSVPYVDVTLTPIYQFQNPQSNPARDIALAFVVADPDNACVPSWGGAYTMAEAAGDLELDRRITQLRAAGGEVMVSFGGQANEELAFACADQNDLEGAYRSVVERYDLHAIDLDIENADLADGASIQRRGLAIAAVQQQRVDAGEQLDVWITLPVSTGGLTKDGIALVTATIENGVEVTGVNAMTMNFGSAENPTTDMLAATKSALVAAVAQLTEIYRGQGVALDESQAWAMLGATPMIGQNDVVGEVFTMDDANGLADFAMTKGLGRVSLWSLNRDAQCGASFADVMVLSNSCSSVDQDPLAFAQAFTVLVGRTSALPQGNAVTVTDPPMLIDDPAASPYPIWRPDAQYPDGFKIVRRGLVYEAKWYTQGFDPSTVTPNPWDSPWALLGRVDPTDVPFTVTTVAPGTHPDWAPTELYATGAKVLLVGLPYEARWPNQGEPPSTLFPVAPDSAWQPLFAIPGEPTAPRTTTRTAT